LDWLIAAGYRGDWPLSEVTKTIFNDPITFPDLIGHCTKDFTFDAPIYVPFVDDPSGYYVQPFFNSKGLCFDVAYSFENGQMIFDWSTEYNAGINGNRYPEASREDAIRYIEKMTCRKVIGVPQYVASRWGPPDPFWEVSADNGKTYDVMGVVGPTDTDPTIILQMWAWNAEDDPRIWLEQKSCPHYQKGS
jgi:hypothetical protein